MAYEICLHVCRLPSLMFRRVELPCKKE
jgi:hypothetical protein